MKMRIIFIGFLLSAMAPGSIMADVSAADSPAVHMTPPAASLATIMAVIGRVYARSGDGVDKGGGHGQLKFAKSGQAVNAGELVFTGGDSRAELSAGAGGIVRLGSRTVFAPSAEGGRLLAGTLLVYVPSGKVREIAVVSGAVRLTAGAWIVQAVKSKGAKLVCIDGPATAILAGDGTGAKPPSGAPVARAKLEAGEIVFLLPGGEGFSPRVTVFLTELLGTSRLVNGFREKLPDLARMEMLALGQSEQLKGVTNALVAGAADAHGFQLAVPKEPGAEKPKP